MNESIVKIIENIKSIFGDTIFHKQNRKKLISAVKDFAEDYEDEKFLVEAIENDDYEDGKSCLSKNDFYDEDNEIIPDTEEGNVVGDILYKLGMEFYKHENYEIAVKYFIKSTEYENADAQCQLAKCFYYGEGIEQNYENAVFWWKKAANKGNVRAMRNFAICYMDGEGVNKDYTQSFYWCKKAAMKEDSQAQLLFALHYAKGLGTEINFIKTIYWKEKAASNQNEDAKNNLVEIYKSIGQVYSSDFEHWGTSDEMFELAISYCVGLDGITLDIDKAIFWFKKSDENGNDGIADLCYMLFSNVKKLNYNSKLLGLAYFTIGSRYQFGDGVEQDDDKAIKFFVEAAKNGDKEAVNILENLGFDI